MTKKDAIKKGRELIENGAGLVEVFEWFEANTDIDAADIWFDIDY